MITPIRKLPTNGLGKDYVVGDPSGDSTYIIVRRMIRIFKQLSLKIKVHWNKLWRQWNTLKQYIIEYSRL